MIFYINKSKCKNKNISKLPPWRKWQSVKAGQLFRFSQTGRKSHPSVWKQFLSFRRFPFVSSGDGDEVHAVTPSSSQQMQPVTVLLVVRQGAAFFSLMVGFYEWRRQEETAAQFFF